MRSVDRGSRDLDDDVIEFQPCVVDKEMRSGPACVSCVATARCQGNDGHETLLLLLLFVLMH